LNDKIALVMDIIYKDLSQQFSHSTQPCRLLMTKSIKMVTNKIKNNFVKLLTLLLNHSAWRKWEYVSSCISNFSTFK